MLQRSGFRRLSYAEALEKQQQRQARARESHKKPARIKPGKKVREWNRIRRELKQECVLQGITSCELQLEGCLGNLYLSFAHSKKRRNIVGDELREACLACQSCHEKIERKPEAEMGEIVRAALAKLGILECDSPSDCR